MEADVYLQAELGSHKLRWEAVNDHRRRQGVGQGLDPLYICVVRGGTWAEAQRPGVHVPQQGTNSSNNTYTTVKVKGRSLGHVYWRSPQTKPYRNI